MLNNLKCFCKGVILNANPCFGGAIQKDTNGTVLKADTTIENCILDGKLWVGKSANPVTDDDYKLGEIVPYTLLREVDVSTVSEIIDGRHTKTFVRTFTYLGENTIVLNELGLHKTIKYSVSGQQLTTDFLLARELFSSPIVVRPNETFTVSMRFEI